MREILFKGKRKDNGEWVEGFLVKKTDPLLGIECWFILVQEYDTSCIDGKPTLLESLMTWYKVIPESASEFSGSCDKNGKKIFEGDILHCISYRDMANMVVIFEEGEFRMVLTQKYKDYVEGGGYYAIRCFDKEVIGNIHDNPELLKEGEGK